MNYPTGEKITLGDRLKLWDGCIGEVVCSIDDSEYSDKFTKKDWDYLEKGILVDSPTTGLIHFVESEPTFELLSRGHNIPSEM